MALPFLNQVSNGTNTVMEAESLPDHIQTARRMAMDINTNVSPLQRMEMLRVIKENISEQLYAESEYEKDRLNQATLMLQRIEGCLSELNQ